MPPPKDKHAHREHRRRRFRRHGRRAYIRSVYFLPSMATLGNAICGFAAIYVSTLRVEPDMHDPITAFFARNSFVAAAYLIFLAMVFDALDGRLARFTRHTTDFGGQLDSLADVISFGVAPAFLAIQVFRHEHGTDVNQVFFLSRLIWAVGALYMSCAAMRLARFNVSNEHGEQHHFSFLGLPSPGAGGTVAAFVLMQQELWINGASNTTLRNLSGLAAWILPGVVLATGLLMVSNIRYPHLVNRYLRGRRSIARVISAVVVLLLLVVWHQYVLAIATLLYTLSGPLTQAYLKLRSKASEPGRATAPPTTTATTTVVTPTPPTRP